MVYLLNMVSFHGYVSLPEGKSWINPQFLDGELPKSSAGRSVASTRNAWGWEPLSSPGAEGFDQPQGE